MIDLQKIVCPSILNLKPYSSARDEFTGKEGVFLDANENPFGKLNRYPDPYQIELKQKLSELKGVESDTIFVGNGSDEVIDLAYRIFCEPNKDKVLTFSPTYGMYEVSANINNVEILKLPLNPNFEIDIETLKPYLSDKSIKLLFICSPNNPTGNTMAIKDIRYILANFHGVVIVDEAYIDFSTQKSCVSLLKEYNNLIVSQTFSKAWGLASVRVGVAYSNHQIINLYNKVKPPYNISLLNQKAVIEALNDEKKYQEKVNLILEERKKLQNELSKLALVKKIYPSDANFLLVEVNNADKIYDELVKKKVIVRNRNQQVKNCLRITVGTPEENQKLIKALQELV